MYTIKHKENPANVIYASCILSGIDAVYIFVDDGDIIITDHQFFLELEIEGQDDGFMTLDGIKIPLLSILDCQAVGDVLEITTTNQHYTFRKPYACDLCDAIDDYLEISKKKALLLKQVEEFINVN